MVSTTSSSVSPRPSMMDDLVYTPHPLAARSTSRLCTYPARASRTRRCRDARHDSVYRRAVVFTCNTLAVPDDQDSS